VVVLALLVGWYRASRRHRRLENRFGSEYERTVDKATSRRKGERELREREAQHAELVDLQPLSDEARQRYEEKWNLLQFRFVDRPQVALADADALLTEVMRDRGYPVDDFDSKSRLVSVDHPNVVANYRTGHDIFIKTVEGRATTEDLRQAVISYRALFDDLVREGAEPAS
jgi:hypothetical protein